jgi:hypothetical protein
MSRFYLLLWFLMVGFVINSSAQNATVRETTQTLATYPFSDPDPVPKPGRIYPYFRYYGYTDKPVMKDWKFIELENDYIKVYITPEIGGKIWGAYEKSTNFPFIYFNHVVKFRDVAMRGAWTSGGIEINFGDIGHAPTVSAPVDYFTRTNADGSVSCFLGAWDWSARTRWMVEVNLPKDKAYFTTKSHWYNATAFETSYYHWMNAGFKAAGNLEFVFPGTNYIGHDGEVGPWPKDSLGRNLNFYEQNNFGTYKSYHVLGKRTDFYGGFWHDDNMGFARYSPYHEKLGKKIWIWGLSREGMIWEKLLTDNDGQYVELQSGRLFNQAAEGSMYSPFKHVSFMPYTHDSWTEYWFPVKHTRGLTHATPEIALNLRVQNGWLKWDACAISPLNDTLTMSVPFTRDVPVKRLLQLKPLETTRDSVRWSGEVEKLVIKIGDELIADGQPTATRRPLVAPKEFDWNSEYGLYTQAKDLANQRKYEEAATYLKKVIEKNKHHVDALADLGELYLNFKIGWQGHALPLIKQALAINAYHPKANYLQGMMEWNMVGSLDYFGVASLHSAYRSPALTQLAIRAIRNQEWAKADEFVQQAIEANSTNFDALQLEIVVARKRGKNAQALKLIKELLFKDPLNHFARFENTLITNGEDDKKAFSGLIKSELPHETYLEIALWYNKLRLFEEGLQVLEYAPKEVMVLLWKSELMSQLSKDGKQYEIEALKMSPERVFPFRNEDNSLFFTKYLTSDNEMGSYYLFLSALALKQVDAKGHLRIRKGEPEIKYAPYYLAKAELLKDEKEEMLKALEKAYEIDPKSWRVVKRLAEFYAANGELKKAIRINEEKLTKYLKTKKVETSGLPEHEIYILGQQRAELLKQAGRYKEALEVVNSLTILPNEGASGAHKLYRELNIRYAATLNQQKKYREAFAVLEQAETWPENLGSGEPYDPDNRLTAYLKKKINLKIRNKPADDADLLKLTKALSASDFALLQLFE